MPLTHVKDRIPEWGWLRQRIKSYTTPTDEIADQLLALIEYDRKSRPKPRPESPISKRGAGFGYPEINVQVEAAAIAIAKRHYETAGWQVMSVEQEKCGYDLRCRRKNQVLCVEVKGVSGSVPAFMLTVRELQQAKTNPNFVLCIVTLARSESAKLEAVPGRRFLARYTLEPLAYSARLR